MKSLNIANIVRVIKKEGKEGKEVHSCKLNKALSFITENGECREKFILKINDKKIGKVTVTYFYLSEEDEFIYLENFWDMLNKIADNSCDYDVEDMNSKIYISEPIAIRFYVRNLKVELNLDPKDFIMTINAACNSIGYALSVNYKTEESPLFFEIENGKTIKPKYNDDIIYNDIYIDGFKFSK